MRTVRLLGLLLIGLALSAGDADASRQEGSAEGALTHVIEVRPTERRTFRLRVASPPSVTPGTEVGVLARDDGRSVASVSVDHPHRCDGPPRVSGLEGGSVCLRVDRFPSATSASSVLRLADDAELDLSVDAHHPRWIAFVVAGLAFVVGLAAASLGQTVIPDLRAQTHLRRAQDRARAAGIADVPDWLSSTLPSLSTRRKVDVLETATQDLASTLDRDRAALRTALGKLANGTVFVERDPWRPDLSAAAVESGSTSLRLADAYDETGSPIDTPAQQWIPVVRLAERTAARLTDLTALVNSMGPDERAHASRALDRHTRRFRDLELDAPDAVGVDTLETIRRQLEQEYLEYSGAPLAPTGVASAPAAALPGGAGTAPQAPPRTGAIIALALPVAVAVVLGGALILKNVLDSGVGSSFGLTRDYLLLAATLVGAGAGAQGILKLLPSATG